MTDEGFVIESYGLTKRYGTVPAVTGVTFEVSPHRVTGFLGRNGAGKSTTIKMLLGMVHPSDGTAKVLGHRIEDPRASIEIRRRVAYVGEDKGLYPYLTVGELIRFTRSFYADWRADIERQLLKAYQLPLGRKVKALSKGMQTKAWRESRTRFLLSAAALTWGCAVVVLVQQLVRANAEAPMTYMRFIWSAVYKDNSLRDLYNVLALTLVTQRLLLRPLHLNGNYIMSGRDMPYFNSHTDLVIGPFPWRILLVTLTITLGLIALAVRITRTQDFA